MDQKDVMSSDVLALNKTGRFDPSKEKILLSSDGKTFLNMHDTTTFSDLPCYTFL